MTTETVSSASSTSSVGVACSIEHHASVENMTMSTTNQALANDLTNEDSLAIFTKRVAAVLDCLRRKRSEAERFTDGEHYNYGSVAGIRLYHLIPRFSERVRGKLLVSSWLSTQTA